MNFILRNHLVRTLALTACFTLGTVAAADKCDEAKKWYDEGIALSDNSEREASSYQRAIELCPDYFEAHNKLGEVYKSWGDYGRATKEFKIATKKRGFVAPHYNLGEIYRMRGRYDLAAKEFIESLRIQPDFVQAENQLKYVEKRLGKYDAVVDPPRELIPVSTFTRIPGMTLPKGTYLIDFQYRYWRQESDIDEDLFVGEAPPLIGRPNDRVANVHARILGIRYGLTDNFTVGLLPMYFTREAEVDLPTQGIEAEPKVRGFGDTVFMTKYRLWGRRQTHLSLYHLLSIPTGDEDAEDRDDVITRRIQLGSGDFEFSPGVAFSAVAEPFTIHTNVSYVFTEGRQAGDEFRTNIAVALPRLFNAVPILELNYRWRDSDTRQQYFQTQLFRPPTIGPPWDPSPGGPISHEVTIKERGGHTLFVSPGVQFFITKRLKAEIGIQVPIVKPADDLAWTEEVVLHVGVMKYFF